MSTFTRFVLVLFIFSCKQENISSKSGNCDHPACSESRSDSIALGLYDWRIGFDEDIESLVLYTDDSAFVVCNSEGLEDSNIRQRVSCNAVLKSACSSDKHFFIRIQDCEVLNFCKPDFEFVDVSFGLYHTNWELVEIQVEDSVTYPPCESSPQIYQFKENQNGDSDFPHLLQAAVGVNGLWGNYKSESNRIYFDSSYGLTLEIGTANEIKLEARLLDFFFSGDTVEYSIIKNLLTLKNLETNEELRLKAIL